MGKGALIFFLRYPYLEGGRSSEIANISFIRNEFQKSSVPFWISSRKVAMTLRHPLRFE